jgi:cis-L-3-hydroxyproline dehydratase
VRGLRRDVGRANVADRGTPEATAAPDGDRAAIGRADLADVWTALNDGPEEVDLVAIGSPHASISECRALADAFGGRRRRDDVAAFLTAGRDVIAEARREGVLSRLERAGVQVLPDICWCSISEPPFPRSARTVMTNSGKYAHYGPALCGRSVRFAALAECVQAALERRAPPRLPAWLK